MNDANIHAASNAVIAKAMAQDPTMTKASPASNPAGVVKRTNAYFIDPTRITRREGWNPRFDFGEIEVLAKSIKANGVLNSIRVKRLVGNPAADFELIDGDRRLTAITQILKTDPDAFPTGIPAVIVDKAQDDVTSLIQMFEANSGKVFLPLEEAAAYQRMQEAGMTLKQICAAVGRKQVHVSEILNLLKADDSVKEAVASGAIGKTMAKRIATVAKGDAETQKALTQQAKEAGKDQAKRTQLKTSVDKAHRASAAKRGKVLKIRALSDAQLSEIGAKMAEHLVALMGKQGLSIEMDLVGMFRKDPMLVIAYSAGALDALKVAAGGNNDLVL